MDGVDYAGGGLDIQYAMLDHFKKYPNKRLRPDHILWDGLKIKTGDWWEVPLNSNVRIEIIESRGEIEQAVDIHVESGFLNLRDGRKISLLRTWANPLYENVVEYPYFSKEGRFMVNNVFRRVWPNGRATEEKWTGNAGFWVEEISPLDRIYHCSHGVVPTPDFSLFTFRVSVAASPNDISSSETAR